VMIYLDIGDEPELPPKKPHVLSEAANNVF
jgi:hypothetical protein